jgi:hypothetical protein
MSIRFAAAGTGEAHAVRGCRGARAGVPANDTGRAANDSHSIADPVLRDALIHFARHGLNAPSRPGARPWPPSRRATTAFPPLAGHLPQTRSQACQPTRQGASSGRHAGLKRLAQAKAQP